MSKLGKVALKNLRNVCADHGIDCYGQHGGYRHASTLLRELSQAQTRSQRQKGGVGNMPARPVLPPLQIHQYRHIYAAMLDYDDMDVITNQINNILISTYPAIPLQLWMVDVKLGAPHHADMGNGGSVIIVNIKIRQNLFNQHHINAVLLSQLLDDALLEFNPID